MKGRENRRRGRYRVEEWVRAYVLRFRPEIAYTSGLEIVFHRNTNTLISLSGGGRRRTLRLHEVFSNAPLETIEAIVRCFFTKPGPRQRRQLRAQIMDFLDRHRTKAVLSASPPRMCPPRGRVYDLVTVRDRVIERYVPEWQADSGRPQVGWSLRKSPSLMGRWVETAPGLPNAIVVNRLLDDPRVPAYYVEYIVFHELLHELIPIRREKGRWIHHGAEFRRRERLFPHYAAAQRWENVHLRRLWAQEEGEDPVRAAAGA